MNRLITPVTIAAGVFAILTTGTQAQENKRLTEQPRVEINISSETVLEQQLEWEYDKNKGHTRLRSLDTRLPQQSKMLKTTTEINQFIDIELSEPRILCESNLDLEYYQKDTTTEVLTSFSSSNCDDFDANYQIRITYFDANRELKRIVENEAWPAGRKAQYRKTYPMEANSELKRVTSHIVSCTCK